MSDSTDSTGVVLAGGFSQRFGDRDKALARVAGDPLIARVVTRLGKVTDAVVVNCRADQRGAFERALSSVPVAVRFVEDPEPDEGPLVGFRTALGRVETGTCALVACDTPFLDPATLSDLTDRLADSTAIADDAGTDVVAVATPDGRVHPTQATYRTAPTEAACRSLTDAGERRLSALLDRLDFRAVPADEVAGNVARSRFDVDTPADHERATEMLREGCEPEVVSPR